MDSQRKRQIAASIIVISEISKRKKRALWTKKWLLKRCEWSHMNLLNEMRLSSTDDYRNFLRMDENLFLVLLNKVRPLIERSDSVMREAISVDDRLAVTLRFLATGRSYEDLKFSAIISPQALSNIIPETCQAIFEVLNKEYMKFPVTTQEWLNIGQEYNTRWNFPNCGGSIDGKHIRITKPSKSGSYYFNYKEYFSIVLMAIVNANYEFIYVYSGVNGRVSDGGVIERTSFYRKLISNDLKLPSIQNTTENLNFVFVADDAFALHQNVLKPYPQKNLSREKRIFNYRLSRARRVVENAFGILAARFRIFHTCINLHPDKVDYIIMAACTLHNFLKKQSKYYVGVGSLDHENVDDSIVTPGEWRNYISNHIDSLQINNTRNHSEGAKQCRENYTTYFNTIGKVPWQDEIINR